MTATVEINNRQYKIDLSAPIDISIPFNRERGVNAFGAKPYNASPFKDGDFIGSLEAGSPVNFYDLTINPHGNGTHTESMLHIDDRGNSIHETLKRFHFLCALTTITPKQNQQGDRIIEQEQLDFQYLIDNNIEALVIRTRPNLENKKSMDYTGTNPPYVSVAFIEALNKTPVKHLLIDLPSVDREQDEGRLSAHHAFWNTNREPVNDKTISELVFIDNDIEDGLFLLNLQIISVDIDASPSKPVLYRIIDHEVN